MPEFHLAYYDHVLRRDADGQWWFEALATEERRAALDRRLAHLRALLGQPGDGPARVRRRSVAAAAEPRGRRPSLTRSPPAARGSPPARSSRPTSACGWTAAGTAPPPSCWPRALAAVQPAYGASFDTPDGAIASLSPELFLRRRGDEVVTAPIKGTAPRDADPAGGRGALRPCAARPRTRPST